LQVRAAGAADCRALGVPRGPPRGLPPAV